jgi:hypothetical protein
MSITLVTYPSEYDNRASWTVTTNLNEDSSHVNLRVEAHLYKSGTLIAKKVMPKGYTSFDFKNILRDQIKFQNPLISDQEGQGIIQPLSAGGNLITGWTNSAIDPFDTFASSGPQITSAITSNHSIAYTNQFSMIKGKLYAFIWEGVVNSMTDADTLTLEANYANGHASNMIRFSTFPTGKRYFLLMCNNTGTQTLSFVCNNGKSVNFT